MIMDNNILNNIDKYLNNDIKMIIYNYFIDINTNYKKNINNHIKIFFNIKSNTVISNNFIFKIEYLNNLVNNNMYKITFNDYNYYGNNNDSDDSDNDDNYDYENKYFIESDEYNIPYQLNI